MENGGESADSDFFGQCFEEVGIAQSTVTSVHYECIIGSPLRV